MTKTLKYLLCCAVLVFLIVACGKESGLRPFSSDGCSLFPDSSMFSDKDWCSCCFEHDLTYWRGGTADERLLADQRLRTCIIEETEYSWLATLMYSGVRIGGSPYVFSWFRWGYGWSYDRKYQVLSKQENILADSLLENYYANPIGDVCEK